MSESSHAHLYGDRGETGKRTRLWSGSFEGSIPFGHPNRLLRVVSFELDY